MVAKFKYRAIVPKSLPKVVLAELNCSWKVKIWVGALEDPVADALLTATEPVVLLAFVATAEPPGCRLCRSVESVVPGNEDEAAPPLQPAERAEIVTATTNLSILVKIETSSGIRKRVPYLSNVFIHIMLLAAS